MADTAKNEKIVELLSPYETIKAAENAALSKTVKTKSAVVFSAVTAGIYISIAFAFYITATTGTGNVAYGLAKLTGGLCFSLGLTLCVVLGADLFTSTILNCVPAANKKISLSTMSVHWVLVYFGNLLGALFFVALVWFAEQHTTAHGAWGLNVLTTASNKLHHTFTAAVFLGILANLMVCLAVWMSFSGRSLIDKTLIMMLPVAMFVASGFEHSIANMFLIPMGIIIRQFASPDYWQIIHMTPDNFADLTINGFIFKNLIPVTIGNIIGGLMVGLIYWSTHLHKKNAP